MAAVWAVPLSFLLLTVFHGAVADKPKSCGSGQFGPATSFATCDIGPTPGTTARWWEVNAFTLEFWIRPKCGVSTVRTGIFSTLGTSILPGRTYTSGYALAMEPTCFISFITGAGPVLTVSLTADSWQHVTATYTSDVQGNATLIVSPPVGSDRTASGTGIISWELPSATFFIGRLGVPTSANPDTNFNGFLDEIRLWSKVLNEVTIFNNKPLTEVTQQAGLMLSFPIKMPCDFKDKSGNKRDCVPVFTDAVDYSHNFMDDCYYGLGGYGTLTPDSSMCPEASGRATECVFSQWSDWGTCQDLCACGADTCPSVQVRNRTLQLPINTAYESCAKAYFWDVGACRFDGFTSSAGVPGGKTGTELTNAGTTQCAADPSCVGFDTGPNGDQINLYRDPKANADFPGGNNWLTGQGSTSAAQYKGVCYRKTQPLNYTKPCTAICNQDCVWGPFGQFQECSAPPAELATSNLNAVTLQPIPKGIDCTDQFKFPNFLQLVITPALDSRVPCHTNWVDRDYISFLFPKYGPTETTLNPKPGDVVADGLVWTMVDRASLATIIDGCALVYFSLAIFASEDMDISPLFQHDDEGKIWLDGVQVVNLGGWNSQLSPVTPAKWTLKAGWHNVVIRVHNGGGLGSMAFAFKSCPGPIMTLPYIPWDRNSPAAAAKTETTRGGLGAVSNLAFWPTELSLGLSFRYMAAASTATELPLLRYGTTPGPLLEIRASGTQVVVNFYGATGSVDKTVKGGPINNVVHNLAIIKTDTTFKVFMDATLLGTATWDKTPTGVLDIGYNNATKASFVGDIDDLVFLNKAVPPCQLFGKALEANLDSAFAYYDFETFDSDLNLYKSKKAGAPDLLAWGEYVTPLGSGLRALAWNGQGQNMRTRVPLQFQKGTGKECTGTATESKACTGLTPCAIPCVLSDWSAFGACSTACDAGVQNRSRTIITPPSGGAPPCDIVTDQRACDPANQKCPPECKLGPWTNTSSCTKPCAGGTMNYIRVISCGNCVGGDASVCGPTTEIRACNEQACEQDCVLSAWGDWSTCSQECGYGVKTRFRTITTEPTPGGVQCDALTQSQGCSLKVCPADCIFGEWLPSGNCSLECGGGQMEWRRPTQPTEFAISLIFQEDSTFDGPFSVNPYRMDNTHTPEIVGFLVGNLGPGSLTVGSTTTQIEFGKMNQVSTATILAGRTLPPVDAWGTQTLSTNYINPIIFMGPTTYFGTDPLVMRVRNVQAGSFEWQMMEYENKDQVHMAEDLSWMAVEAGRYALPSGDVLEAALVQSVEAYPAWKKVTFTQPMPEPPVVLAQVVTVNDKLSLVTRLRNVDATGFEICLQGSEVNNYAHKAEDVHWIAATPGRNVFGSFQLLASLTPDSVGLATYTQKFEFPTTQFIGIVAQVQSCIDVDPGNLRLIDTVGEIICPDGVESRDCNPQVCDVDCVMGPWSEPDPCSLSCGTGVQTRTRVVAVQPQGNGAQCNATTVDEPCNTDPCPPDCTISPWVNGTCNLPCGSGTLDQTRTVTCSNCANENVEAVCGPTKQQLTCNETPCPVPCVISAWTLWTQCTKECGGGTQNRTRYVETPAQYGGEECPTEVEQVQACEEDPCPVDCLLSVWGDWSPCNVPCSVGIRSRNRTVMVEPLYGGANCTALLETEECYMDPCPPDCDLGPWVAQNCSVECGGGTMISNRVVTCTNCKPEEVNTLCGDTTKSEACNPTICPIDCVLSDWGAYGTCSTPCGPGTQISERTVTTYAQGDGLPCDTVLSRSQECKVADCPPKCNVTDWVAQGDCSVACGGGTQTYDRSVGGSVAECGAESESRICNTQPCDTDCKLSPWSEWSVCDAPCDMGSQWRSRQVLAVAIGNGKACPTELRETQECTVKQCEPTCNPPPTNWASSGDCSKPCGGGLQKFVRSVVGDPVTCGKSEKSEPCNEQACPSQCVYSEWSVWSACSAPCGEGTQTAQRSVLVVSTGDAPQCAEELVKTQACPNPPTCQQECKLGAWVPTGGCSRDCGGGEQYYTRTVSATSWDSKTLDPTACGPAMQTLPCNTNPCTNSQCVMNEWSTWSECSESCGGGQTTRTRSVRTDGVVCPERSDVSQTQTCNPQQCSNDDGSTCMPTWGSWNESTCVAGAGGNQTNEDGCPLMSRVAIRHSGQCKPEDLIGYTDCDVSTCAAAAGAKVLPATPYIIVLVSMLVACCCFLGVVGLLHLRRVKNNSNILDYKSLSKKGSEYNALNQPDDDELDDM